MIEIRDIHSPAAPGSLMRCCRIDQAGKFRISRQPSELYSVQIICSGAWGRLRVMTGDGRTLWYQPSTFTGSFVLAGGSDDGLIVELSSEEAPVIMVNWREINREMV